MNNELRAELLDMRAADQAAAVAAFHASERDPRFRGKFLFQIPRAEWIPAFHRAAEVAARNASLTAVLPLLDEDTRVWLRDVVERENASHPWLARM